MSHHMGGAKRAILLRGSAVVHPIPGRRKGDAPFVEAAGETGAAVTPGTCG
ncbi:hypothetical protein GCM10023347_31850 [Streptomyces chumphonensis]